MKCSIQFKASGTSFEMVCDQGHCPNGHHISRMDDYCLHCDDEALASVTEDEIEAELDVQFGKWVV